MNKILVLLKQRRLWASIFAFIAIILPLFGVEVDFNADSATSAVMGVVEALIGLLAVVLPIWSFIKPKK